MDAGGTPQQLLKGFNPLLVLTEALGLILVALVAIWCGQKGFGWRANPGLEFNWHPLLMVIAMVFLNGNGKSLVINQSACYSIFENQKVFN